MPCQTPEDVLRLVRDKESSFIQFWFTDILGLVRVLPSPPRN